MKIEHKRIVNREGWEILKGIVSRWMRKDPIRNTIEYLADKLGMSGSGFYKNLESADPSSCETILRRVAIIVDETDDDTPIAWLAANRGLFLIPMPEPIKIKDIAILMRECADLIIRLDEYSDAKDLTEIEIGAIKGKAEDVAAHALWLANEIGIKK